MVYDFTNLSFQNCISKEMNRRFSSSRSSESTRTDSNYPESPSSEERLSPPQVYGVRKKLTDLKIEQNFVPMNGKNNAKSKTLNGKSIAILAKGPNHSKLRGIHKQNA